VAHLRFGGDLMSGNRLWMDGKQMVDKIFDDISVAAQRYTGLARKAIDYGLRQKQILDRVNQPDYSEDEWYSLKDFVAADEFERVGNFKEVMNSNTMIAFLQKWSRTSRWEGSFKRVTEHDNVVILELEERNTYNGHTSVVNSVSIYEFNSEGKLRHLDVYLQTTPAGGFPNEAYT
jgi:hypothetical protein